MDLTSVLVALAVCVGLFLLIVELLGRARDRRQRREREALLRLQQQGRSAPAPDTAWPPPAAAAPTGPPGLPPLAARSIPPTTTGPTPPPAAGSSLDLSGSDFAPISDAEAKRMAGGLGSLWASPWFGRRDRIPPADDPR